MSLAYIDASALVKLFKPEAETAALIEALRSWPGRMASSVIAIEASCAARRLGEPAVLERAAAAVERIELVPLSDSIVELARGPFEPPLRALDAIHLATAIDLRDYIGSFFAYDSDLLAAAVSLGVPVESPEGPRRSPGR